MNRRSVARWITAVVAGLALAAAGCQTTGGTAGSGGDPSGTGSEFREDPIGSETGSAVSGTAVDAPKLETVYFDFDRFDIREDVKPILRSNAQAILENTEWGTISIEGHCDERGSEEYNLALGERRANGVKRYLVDLGVPSSRLLTVSFGEAKPSVAGHDESAWKFNRRSEFRTGR
jgi:peptidoglycan-associated lipoprotein